MALQVGNLKTARGIVSPDFSLKSNFQPTTNVLGGTVKGNPNVPVAKSDFSNEYFTDGYYTRADRLDCLA